MPNDDQLQKKARRRLIGAVVFVLFTTLLLLFAMDAEPPAAPPPTLVIPLEDGATEVFTLDGSLALPQTSPPPEPATDKPAAIVRAEPPRPIAAPTPAAAKPAPSPAPAVVKPVPTPAAAKPAPSSASTAVSPTPGSASSPAPTPAPVANPAIQDANRAAAILAGRSPETASPPAAATSYVVQVIASGNMDTVQNTVERLRALRLPVYTEAAGGNMTRVRVGPYNTQSEAEAAERRINQDGKITGTKIFPQSPSPR